MSSLLSHLRDKSDSEMLGLLPLEELNLPEQGIKGIIVKKPSEARAHDPGNHYTRESTVTVAGGYSAFLTTEEVRQLFAEKYIEDISQKRLYITNARTFKLWANYIAALLLDKEAKARGESERWFEPKDIRIMLKKIMPFHYDKEGAKESSLLTADVKVGSKYNLGFPCLENRTGTRLYRFVGFKE